MIINTERILIIFNFFMVVLFMCLIHNLDTSVNMLYVKYEHGLMLIENNLIFKNIAPDILYMSSLFGIMVDFYLSIYVNLLYILNHHNK